jgi:hypothetical protein
LLMATVLLVPVAAHAANQAPSHWTRAASIPGVLDAAGPRADGRTVIVAAGKLYLLSAGGGALQSFAGGPGGYPGPGGEEPYIALSPGATGPGCSFARDDLFILQLKPAGGVLRIDPQGIAHNFANVNGVDLLNGIAFDTTGAFGHRLLVTGPRANQTTLAAIDCNGAVTPITRQAPIVEGGIAVAPASFGTYAGDLVAADELSGNIYAFAPTGEVRTVARPNLAVGGDIGVEGAGFIPPAPVAGLTAYFADRGTPGNPHPGTDHLLALTSDQLASSGAQPGDLLVATEGGAGMVGVRCSTSCTWYPVTADNAVSHGEGHVLLLSGAPGSLFTTAPAAVQSTQSSFPFVLIGAIAAAVLVVLAAIAGVVLWRVRAHS